MVSVENLTVAFGAQMVIDSVSFSVDRSTILVVLGKNGSGKSVLLKALAALLPPSSGRIQIDGKDVSPDNLYDARAQSAMAGYVFQRGGLFDSMNLFDNVAFGLRRRRVDEEGVRRLVGDSLEKVGLGDAGEKYPSELSGGMQKRAGLARALCLQPQILLYDDPTAGLDPILTDQIADLILSIRAQSRTTSVVVTHDLKFAQKIADSLILLYDGKIAYQAHRELFFNKNDPYARQFIEGDTEGPIDIY